MADKTEVAQATLQEVLGGKPAVENGVNTNPRER